MSLKYTTVEAIAARLNTRLSLTGPQSPFGTTVVDPALVAQVAGQIEARVDSVIQQNSKIVPAAAATRAIRPETLAAVVEKGVICEIGAVHFAAEEEGKTYSNHQCKQYEAALLLLGEEVSRLPGNNPKPQAEKPVYGFSGAARRSQGAIEEIDF